MLLLRQWMFLAHVASLSSIILHKYSHSPTNTSRIPASDRLDTHPNIYYRLPMSWYHFHSAYPYPNLLDIPFRSSKYTYLSKIGITLTFDLIVHKFPLVNISIGETYDTFSSNPSLLVLTFIIGAIVKLLSSNTVLSIVSPFTNILAAVQRWIGSEAICTIIDPLPLVHISIRMNQYSPPFGDTRLKATIIATPIKPNLSTSTFLFAS